MKRIKIKFNYANEFRIFDATLAIIDHLQGTGSVMALTQLESECFIFLAPGNYLAQAIYDQPDAAGGKRTCLFERQFHSDEIERLSIDFKKPTTMLPGFTEPELAELANILKSTIGGKVNPRTAQAFAINTVKGLGRAASLDERVVIDKNGKVEYQFSYNEQEQELYDYVSPEELGLDPDTAAATPEPQVEQISPLAMELPSLRPVSTLALNYGHWNVNLYGLNTNIGAPQRGYRNLRAIAYLRPRAKLFHRLPGFIAENMAVARRVNNL